jgi:hypothetical protein
MMSGDCGDQLVLNVNFGTIACSQLLQTWPGCFASKCIQSIRDPTFNCIVDNQGTVCTVS